MRRSDYRGDDRRDYAREYKEEFRTNGCKVERKWEPTATIRKRSSATANAAIADRGGRSRGRALFLSMLQTVPGAGLF